jgi:hypothetical protein
LSAGKFQRGSDGKFRRNTATGKLRRNTATNTNCCCGAPGFCTPLSFGCVGLTDLVDEGFTFPAYYRIIVAGTAAVFNTCRNEFGPATGCVRTVGPRGLIQTGGGWNGTYYVCRQTKIGTNPPWWFYGCAAEMPLSRLTYQVHNVGCSTPLPLERIDARISLHVSATSTPSPSSGLIASGNAGVPSDAYNGANPSAGFCLRWRVWSKSQAAPPPNQIDFTIPNSIPPLSLINETIPGTLRITSGNLLPPPTGPGVGGPPPEGGDAMIDAMGYTLDSARAEVQRGSCCDAPKP